MIRVCMVCGKPMGEKAPFEDKSVTTSICPDCLEEENRKLDAKDKITFSMIPKDKK